MSFSLYGESGYIQDVASIGGWWKVIKSMDSYPSGPLIDLVNTGKTTDPLGAIKQIDSILPSITDKDVKTTLEGLKEGLQKVKEIAIIGG